MAEETDTAAAPETAAAPDKKRLVAMLLCFFLGGLGVHRFYVGKTGSGVAQILTLGGIGHLGSDRLYHDHLRQIHRQRRHRSDRVVVHKDQALA